MQPLEFLSQAIYRQRSIKEFNSAFKASKNLSLIPKQENFGFTLKKILTPDDQSSHILFNHGLRNERSRLGSIIN